MRNDVEHPAHYAKHPSGVECIEITENENFNIGNATKYLFREGRKGPDPTVDIEKALWYINREIAHRQTKTIAERITALLGRVASVVSKDKGDAMFHLWLATLDPTGTWYLEVAKKKVEAMLAQDPHQTPK